MKYLIDDKVIYDDMTHRLFVKGGGKPFVRLGIKESEIFKGLCLSTGLVVKRETLISIAWPNAISANVNLNVAILSLRRKLAMLGLDLIKTVPRVGYLLECKVIGENGEGLVIPPFMELNNDLVFSDRALVNLMDIMVEESVDLKPVKKNPAIKKPMSKQAVGLRAVMSSLLIAIISFFILLLIRFLYLERLEIVDIGSNKIVGYSTSVTTDVVKLISTSLSRLHINNIYVAIGKDSIAFISRNNTQRKVLYIYDEQQIGQFLEHLDDKLTMSMPFLLDHDLSKEKISNLDISFYLEKNIQLICFVDARDIDECIYAISNKQITSKSGTTSSLKEHVKLFCGKPSGKPFFVYKIGGFISNRDIKVEHVWYQQNEEGICLDSAIKKRLILLIIESLTNDERYFKLWGIEPEIYFSDMFRGSIYHYKY